jgi:2-keto-4-pentenoate hydratase/2-oxohepta-3-ene-1,7-dioic acid hydratase in catechol pathway
MTKESGSSGQQHHDSDRNCGSETLHSGEFFGSGTIGGCCGLELDRWLQPGDVVELEIERLGILRNRVVQAAT